MIDRTAEQMKDLLSGEGNGHDWWHVYRVWKTARRIGEAEGADLTVVELAAHGGLRRFFEEWDGA